MKKTVLATGLIIALTLSSTYAYAVTSSKELKHVGSNEISTMPVSDQQWTPTALQEKMLNSIDNFKTIKGTYHSVQKHLGIDETVSFNVKEGNTPGSYSKKVNNKSGEIVEERADGNFVLVTDFSKKEFIKDKLTKERSDIPNVSRMFVKDGVKNYVHRQDPAAATLAQDMIFPQNYAFWMSEADYQITGHETYLNRDATVVSGNVMPIINQRHGSTEYKMWVDTDTGVLLKIVETNAAGEVTNLLEMTKLNLNADVDQSQFTTKEPSNFKDKTLAKTYKK